MIQVYTVLIRLLPNTFGYFFFKAVAKMATNNFNHEEPLVLSRVQFLTELNDIGTPILEEMLCQLQVI